MNTFKLFFVLLLGGCVSSNSYSHQQSDLHKISQSTNEQVDTYDENHKSKYEIPRYSNILTEEVRKACHAGTEKGTERAVPTISGLEFWSKGQIHASAYESFPKAQEIALNAKRDGWRHSENDYFLLLKQYSKYRNDNPNTSLGALNALNYLEQVELNCFERTKNRLVRQIDRTRRLINEERKNRINGRKTLREKVLEKELYDISGDWILKKKQMRNLRDLYGKFRRHINNVIINNKRSDQKLASANRNINLPDAGILAQKIPVIIDEIDRLLQRLHESGMLQTKNGYLL